MGFWGAIRQKMPLPTSSSLRRLLSVCRVYPDLSLEIKEFFITALVGPSGAGKSTFLTTLKRIADRVMTFSL
jgi:ABC-type phosphate transport system ATPase subunit